MSTEELARIFDCPKCDYCSHGENDEPCGNCVKSIAEWLEQEAEKPSIFEPKEGDLFYFLNRNGDVDYTHFGNGYVQSEKLSENGNACTNKSVMERKAHDLKLWSLLWNFAEENNKKMDWEDRYQDRYWLQKEVGVWKVMSLITPNRGLEPYFTSEDIAWRAINEIVLPWERGEMR